MRYLIANLTDADLETIAAALEAYEGLFHADDIRARIAELGARIDTRDDDTVREYDEGADVVEFAP